jgi:hypothetical protein
MANAGSHDWCSLPLPLNVAIGERSWLHSSFAFLHYRSGQPLGLRLGRQTGVYIGSLFDLGPSAEVDIGDFCTLAGSIVSTNRRVSIGDRVLISFQVVIADEGASIPPTSRRLE